MKDIKCFAFAFIATLFVFLNESDAQSWTNYNEVETAQEFRQVQEDFERYWAGRVVGKGSGYKPFKRWEYKWQERIEAEGEIPAAGKHLQEFDKFLKTYDSDNRDANSPWESLGPNSNTSGYAGTGRVMSVGFNPNNSNIIYVGSAGGGLWKSTDGGSTWAPKTDFLGSIGVSAIVVDYNTPSTIYIGTGDGDASDNYSIGVLKSTDSGDTWDTTGLQWNTSSTDLIRNMVMDPNDVNTILVASNIGIYRTTNAGTSWNQVQGGSFYDVDMNPSAATNIFYAATSDDIYKSTDNGANWTLEYTVPNSGRLSIATTAANNSYVYALSSGNSGGANGSSGYNGVYRSTDSGATFSLMSSSPNILTYSSSGTGTGGQGWYDLVIAADPDDANTIHIGGVNHWKSTDGGANWTIKSHWAGSGAVAVHADKHLLEFQDDNTLWEGNDGGIYKTTNGGDTWTDRTTNMVISQMYRIGVSETNTRLLAGLQDNGTKRKNTNGAWNDVLGGDGMDCAVSPIDGNVMYGESQFGNISRSTNGGGNWSSVAGTLPDGAWITPIAVDNENTNTVYAGYNQVYKSINNGGSWTTISESFTGSNMTKLEVSNQDANYIYTGYGNELWGTVDGGTNWGKKSTPGSLSMVKISKTNPKTIYGTASNFNNGNKVYKSMDGGKSWSNISGNLPNIPANCIAIHDDGEETIYVGMDVGIYFKNESTPQWTLMNVDLPNVQIRELEVKESTNQIYVATYGRGVWRNSTIGTLSTCEVPRNLTIDIVDETSGTATWEAPGNVPSNGYEWALNQTIDPPASGTNTSLLTANITGIETGNKYYFHIRSMCAGSTSSWITYGPVESKLTCGGISYDSGGSASDYDNNENIIINICPIQGQTDLTLTFSAFNAEVGYDVLYIHNGPDIDSPLFPGGATSMSNSYPIGGFTGTNIPGPFTSTDASGCITLEFKSDGSVVRPGWIADISCMVDESCHLPLDVTVSDVGSTDAKASWGEPFNVPENGYEYAVTENQTPPTSGTPESTLLVDISGLISETTYYFHLRSACTAENSNWVTSLPFTTKLGCGNNTYDSGGESGEYGNLEDITIVACTDLGSSDLTITFDEIGIELNYDALYIHNGPDINSPLFPGGAVVMLSNFPVGGFNGTTVPGPFTSTDASGCITLRMLSDQSVTGSGWSATLSCSGGECSTIVSNLNDSGSGSLRAAVDCAEEGGYVEIDPSLYQQTIVINQPITINKEINISPPESSAFMIKTDQAGPIYDILASGEVGLHNMIIISGSASTGSAIRNNGILDIKDIQIKKNANTPNPTSLIENNGTLKVTGNTVIEN
ncbi:MAG: photosystem II stability/assembly factor-like uncharacterized protein [Saprospiraceae bacterium]|jgi:photosystem II stability/assembly factor-like uncharacterized protein